jgi:hypothetical protein
MNGFLSFQILKGKLAMINVSLCPPLSEEVISESTARDTFGLSLTIVMVGFTQNLLTSSI